MNPPQPPQLDNWVGGKQTRFDDVRGDWGIRGGGERETEREKRENVLIFT